MRGKSKITKIYASVFVFLLLFASAVPNPTKMTGKSD